MSRNASKSAKSAAPEDHSKEALESKRVQQLSFDQGVISRSRRVATASLPPTKLMAKADGKDIVKKSSARRNRYLLVFNCQLAPAAAGRLGTLAQLDTKNPVMYIEFAEGRLKLLGTLVFPHNKYVVLRLGAKEVVCEDVLESMIVFGKSQWVGCKEENPEERELPMPPALAANKRHSKYCFDARGVGQGAAAGKDTGAEEEEEEEEEEEQAEQQAVAAPPPGARRTARTQAGGKRQRYAEDSDASFGDDSGDDGAGDSDGGPAVRKLPRLGGSQPSAGKAPRRRSAGGASQPESHPVINLAGSSSSTSSSDEEQPPAQRTFKQRLGGLDGFMKKPATKGKAPATKPTSKPAAVRLKKPAAKRSPGGEEEDEELVDLACGSGDSEDAASSEDDGARPLSASHRPQRAAGAAAAKKLRVESGSEGFDEDEGGKGGGEDSGSAGGSGSEEAAGESGSESESESEGYAPSE